jgi:hypothetical protein
MSDDAARYNMSMGLKNAMSLIPKVHSYVQFAVNEECVVVQDCAMYKNFLAKGKPVFHIEYTKHTTGNNRLLYKDPAASTKKYCNPLAEAVSRFSTIIKPGETLGPAFLYCDGKPADSTPIRANSNSKGKNLYEEKFVSDSESSPEADSESAPTHASAKSSGSKPSPRENADSFEADNSSEAEGAERDTDGESSGSDSEGSDSDTDEQPAKSGASRPKAAPKHSAPQ